MSALSVLVCLPACRSSTDGIEQGLEQEMSEGRKGQGTNEEGTNGQVGGVHLIKWDTLLRSNKQASKPGMRGGWVQGREELQAWMIYDAVVGVCSSDQVACMMLSYSALN